MAINLEMPKKFGMVVNQAHQVSTEIFRPISRKYDRAEHEYPKELDMLAALIDGMNASGESNTGARGVRREAGLARRLTAEYGMQIGSNGVQLLGGHGYVKEHPVERWYRDLRAAAVMEGVVLV